METFKVGDIVEAWGVRGKVIEINTPILLSVVVLFEGEEDNFEVYFERSGKYKSWHKEPSLKLIERPKKKVKKTYWFVTSKVDYHSEQTFKRNNSHMYETKEETNDLFMGPGCYDRQVHSIEIEEEV